MKFYIYILALISFVNAETYNNTYSSVNEEKNILMTSDFKEIIRFEEIVFEDDKILAKSEHTINKILLEFKKIKDENFIVSIIGHTRESKDIQRKNKLVSTVYIKSLYVNYDDVLSEKCSYDISKDYTIQVSNKLHQNGIDKIHHVIKNKLGKDNLYVNISNKEKDLSNRVMVSIYILENSKKNIMIKEHNNSNEISNYKKDMLLINYKSNSSIINENSILELNILSKDILKDDDNRIRIDGHTDNINSDKYNLKLSQSRANSVKVYLNNLGIDSERMIINAYGELKPVSSNDTLSGQSMNRRVEVVIINNK